MILTVNRIAQGKNSTLSKIYLDSVFVCYGLEDSVRDKKVKGSTAIPAGTYTLGLRTNGGMHSRYKKDYPKMHRGMIEIMAIPEYSYVYIHVGNNFSDTAGCLLVGDTMEYTEKDYLIWGSAKTYKRLYKMLVDAVGRGEAKIIVK